MEFQNGLRSRAAEKTGAGITANPWPKLIHIYIFDLIIDPCLVAHDGIHDGHNVGGIHGAVTIRVGQRLLEVV